MAKMTVHMIGIMYFTVCGSSNKAKHVLVPNGRTSDGHIAPHFTSVFVEKARCERDDWWPKERLERNVSILNLRGEPVTVPVIEFRMPPRAYVTFPDGETGKVEVRNLEQGLPHLKKVDPYFEPDFDNGDWAAQVAVRGGSLQAFTLNGGVSAVQWTTEHEGSLTINATTGGETRSITMRPQDGRLGAEVVFANAPDLLEAVAHAQGPLHVRPAPPSDSAHGHSHGPDEPHHFRLYGKINRTGDNDRLRIPPHRLSIPHGHAYIKAVGDSRVQGSCTPVCC